MDALTGFLLSFLYAFIGCIAMNALYSLSIKLARVRESLFSPYAARLDNAAFARAVHYLPLLAIYQAPRDLALSDTKYVLLVGVVAPLLEEICFFAAPAAVSIMMGAPLIVATAGVWAALHVITDYWIVEHGENPSAIALDALGFAIEGFIDASCWLGQFGYSILPFLTPQSMPGIARLLAHMILNTIISVREVSELKRFVETLEVESPYFGEPSYF